MYNLIDAARTYFV